MATLKKFKHLATQCGVAGTPTRSPTASPVVHLRRRKTLRMLLGRTADSSKFHHRRFQRRDDSPQIRRDDDDVEDDKERLCRNRLRRRHKLKDLFLSSPPSDEQEEIDRLLPATGSAGSKRIGAGPTRLFSATLRQRFMKTAWRPALVAIPEQSP